MKEQGREQDEGVGNTNLYSPLLPPTKKKKLDTQALKQVWEGYSNTVDQKKKKGCGGDQFSWDIQTQLGTKKGGGYWYQPWSPVVGSGEDPNNLVTQDCNTPTATNSPQLSWWEAPKCSLAWTSVT